MCNRAADECDLAHSRKSDIANVLSAAVEEAVVLLAAKPRTDSSLPQSRPPISISVTGFFTLAAAEVAQKKKSDEGSARLLVKFDATLPKR
jgi:hypothetical protein